MFFVICSFNVLKLSKAFLTLYAGVTVGCVILCHPCKQMQFPYFDSAIIDMFIVGFYQTVILPKGRGLINLITFGRFRVVIH